MEAQGVPVSSGMLIEYFIGEGSGKKIGDRVYLAGKLIALLKSPLDERLFYHRLKALDTVFVVATHPPGKILELGFPLHHDLRLEKSCFHVGEQRTEGKYGKAAAQ